MNTQPTTPQMAKKQREILSVALEVFAREGFANADVQVIADLARVGKGTVYRHFGNKEQLFLATSRFSLDQATEFIRNKMGGEEQLASAVASQGAATVLLTIATACGEYYQRHPQAVELMIIERAQFRASVFPTHLMHREETRRGLDQVMAQAIESGEFRDCEVTAATNAYTDLLYGSVVNGCLAGSQQQLVLRVQSAIQLFLNGLSRAPSSPPPPKRRRTPGRPSQQTPAG